MAEPEKENTSAEPKSNNLLLDDDIGKEFLSSWKSISVTEDDGMDFSFEAIGKGKKNAFNFDKLDMDFTLGGGFDKLSSFNVDMPDLDFSCPSKKSANVKAGNEEESRGGNAERKRGTFSFSFDFNEMDDFNLDSSLRNGELTPKKDKTKELPLVKVDDQGTSLPGDIAVFNVEEKIFPVTKRLETSQVDSKASIPGHISLSNLLETKTSVTKENEKGSDVDTKMSGTPEELDQRGLLLEQGDQRRQCAENEDAMTLKSDSEFPKEPCSLAIALDCSSERDRNFCNNTVNEDQSISGNLQSDSVHFTEQAEGEFNLEETSILDNSKKAQNDTKFERQESNLLRKMDLAKGNREPAANKVTPTSRESGHVHSKFFKTSGDTVKQSDVGPRIIQIGSEGAGTINANLADESSQGCNAKDTRQEGKIVKSLKTVPSEQIRGPLVGGAPKINSISKSGLLNTSSSTRTTDISGIQTCGNPGPEHMASSEEALESSRRISLDTNKVSLTNAETGRSLSSLSNLRPLGRSVELLSLRPLVGATSTKSSEENTELRNSGKLMPHSGGNSEKEKQLILTPSLKRKSYEMSHTNAMSYSPMKRLSESPVESRSPRESSQKLVINEQMREVRHETKGDVRICNVSDQHSPSQVEISSLSKLVHYELTSSLEHDENLEKAESYSKELESLCNMLKRKQDEAKEVLVRAIVNNNHLLMLNHLVFGQKIHTIQKFASRLMAKEVA